MRAQQKNANTGRAAFSGNVARSRVCNGRAERGATGAAGRRVRRKEGAAARKQEKKKSSPSWLAV